MESCRNTTDNRRIVANYIRQKTKLGEGGMVPASFLTPVQTDMDVFPYDRFFRGMVGCDRPRVFDREAGHRRLNPAAYAYQYSPEVTTPRRLWRAHTGSGVEHELRVFFGVHHHAVAEFPVQHDSAVAQLTHNVG